MISLNSKVKDTTTGYSGVVTARAEYITGEQRYLVENVDSTGRPCEYWYDEPRLVVEED